ncbi:MAG: hypothetical protein ACTHZH_10600 [Oleiphilaceae bacterium]
MIQRTMDWLQFFGARKAALVLAGSLTIAGCGGSSGGDSSSADPASGNVAFSGVVTDPAIVGSSVRLVNSEGEVLSRLAQTGINGEFQLELDAEQAEEVAGILATGGKDSVTGLDFSGLALTAPIDGAGDSLVVSPLTTLLGSKGEQELAQILGLSEAEIKGDPAASVNAQRASMLLSELMVALRGVEDANDLIADALAAAGTDTTGGANFIAAAERLEASELTTGSVDLALQSLAKRVAALNLLITDPQATPKDTVEAFNRINLREGVEQYFIFNLGLSETEQLASNADNVADAIWGAIGKRGVPAESSALLNMVRFVLLDNNVAVTELAAGSVALPTAIGADGVLLQLANRNYVDVTQPLASGEELGDDNAARVDYFFRSDASPYFRALQLFEGVYDDALLDPIYGVAAAGQASAGLIDEAELTVSASVFGAVERALAYRSIGLALLDQGDSSAAGDYLKRSRDIYVSYLEAKSDPSGPLELDGDDAAYFQQLSDDFLEAGDEAESNASFDRISTYLTAQQGTYSTAYARLVYAMKRNMEELFEAESDRVVTANRAFREAVYGLGSNGTTRNCNSVRNSLLADVADFAVRLNDTVAVSEALGAFSQSFDNACDVSWSSRISERFAYSFGYLERADEFRQLVEQKVLPESEQYASSALAALFLYDALAKVEEGDLEGAINVIVASTTDIEDQLQALTYDDIIDRNYLAGTLYARGEKDKARQVLDFAYDLSISNEFYNQTSPTTFTANGCAEMSLRYQQWESDELAQEKMRLCKDEVTGRDNQQSTNDQFLVRAVLIPKYQRVGLVDETLELVQSYNDLIPILQTPSDRLAKTLVAGEFFASAGSSEKAEQNLTSTWDLAKDLVNASTTDEELVDAVESWVNVSKYHADVADIIRENLRGENAVLTRSVADLRASAIAELTSGEGIQSSIGQLNSPEDREDLYSDVVSQLARARAFDQATAVAQKADTTPDINSRLKLVAEELVSYDDFPGTTVIRFDFDQDGLPDFFSPQSTAEERTTLGVAMDSDIDGDGIFDTTDIAPYDALNAD